MELVSAGCPDSGSARAGRDRAVARRHGVLQDSLCYLCATAGYLYGVRVAGEREVDVSKKSKETGVWSEKKSFRSVTRGLGTDTKDAWGTERWLYAERLPPVVLGGLKFCDPNAQHASCLALAPRGPVIVR